MCLQQLRAAHRSGRRGNRLRVAWPPRRRIGRGGQITHSVRANRHLRRDGAPGPGGRGGISRPQSSARRASRSRVTRAVVPRRGPGRPGYDLESLLAVAVGVFNQRGYDGTSMEDLSRRLGISKSAIYHHVASKEELLRLALDRALDGLFAVADAARAVDAPAIERLEFLVRGSVQVLQDQLPCVTLLLRVRSNTEVERAARSRRRTFDQFVAELVKEAEGD